jgi:hypothetical protein
MSAYGTSEDDLHVVDVPHATEQQVDEDVDTHSDSGARLLKKGSRKSIFRLVAEYILLVLIIAAMVAGVVVLGVYRPQDWWILLVSPHAFAPMVLVLVTFFTAICELFPGLSC